MHDFVCYMPRSREKRLLRLHQFLPKIYCFSPGGWSNKFLLLHIKNDDNWPCSFQGEVVKVGNKRRKLQNVAISCDHN